MFSVMLKDLFNLSTQLPLFNLMPLTLYVPSSLSSIQNARAPYVKERDTFKVMLARAEKAVGVSSVNGDAARSGRSKWYQRARCRKISHLCWQKTNEVILVGGMTRILKVVDTTRLFLVGT